MLKDGSDSVGMLGALNRVYINIGLFSEEWLLHFNPLIGGPERSRRSRSRAQKRIPLTGMRRWSRRADVALFFLATAQARSPEGRAGRQGLSDHGQEQAEPRQSGFRRELRALPLEQDNRRPRSPKIPSEYAGPGPTISRKMTHGHGRRFSDRQYLSTERRIPVTCCRPMRAARWRPTRLAAISGIISLADL